MNLDVNGELQYRNDIPLKLNFNSYLWTSTTVNGSQSGF